MGAVSPHHLFFPASGTIWNPDCLDVITAYIEALMAERRALVTA